MRKALVALQGYIPKQNRWVIAKFSLKKFEAFRGMVAGINLGVSIYEFFEENQLDEERFLRNM